ncbi:MAG: HAD family phosphatase [Clostridiales bacterium]|nr:HAD family phosphatase [Clostridiales bacterium]
MRNLKDSIKAVIFDLDGLLIDSEMIYYQIEVDFLGRYGHSITKEEYSHNNSGKTLVKNVTYMVEHYNLPVSVEDGLAFVMAREKEYFNQGVPLKPGVQELLQFLKENGRKIIMASSSTRERAEGVLTKNHIIQYFDDMVFGPEIKNGKPHPEIFLKASEKAGEPPQNCLVLEDSEAGIQAAYSAGIPVIGIPDMKVPDEKYQAMATALLPSLLDVISYMEEET